jgi:hypothetical protein
MVPPESKNAAADAEAAAKPEEDFSLMGAIASLSPWATVREARERRCRREPGGRGPCAPVCTLPFRPRPLPLCGLQPQLTRCPPHHSLIHNPPPPDTQRGGSVGGAWDWGRAKAGGRPGVFPAADQQHGP